MRELSISLFRDVVQTVVGNGKRRMKKEVQGCLLLLFFHTHDEADTVARVEISKLAHDTGKGVMSPWAQGQELLAVGLWGACVTLGSSCLRHCRQGRAPICPCTGPTTIFLVPQCLLLQSWKGRWDPLPPTLPPLSPPPAQPIGRVPAHPVQAGAEKLARTFPRHGALLAPAGLSSSPWPKA